MRLPLCVRTDHDDTRSAEALQAQGWRLVGVLLTFRGPARNWIAVGAAAPTPGEHQQVIDLVAASMTHNRLHLDPEVSEQDAAAATREWVAELLQKRTCCVRRIDGRVIGFCAVDDRAVPRIEAVCTHEDFRGRGIARELVKGALAHYSPCAVDAGTYQTNLAAQRLYQSLGMYVQKRQATWHKTL